MNNMDNLDGDKIIEEAEKSLERLSRKIEQLEYDSKRYVLKYFDRLHDKLFMFNTIFITGNFALCQINKEFNSLILLLPFCSLSMLIYIEHFMKEIARKQSYGMFEVNLSEHLNKAEKKYGQVTILSLLIIIVSAIELLYTIYICIFRF